MSNSYLTKASSILKTLKINVKNINSKSEIRSSKSFNATLTPSVKKIIIK